MINSNTSAINSLDNDTISDPSPVVDYFTHVDAQKMSVFSIPSVSPTTEMEVTVDATTTLLNAISSHFSVKSTKYGGRGCFVTSDLTQGTTVYECTSPLSSTIARTFKKEVCGSCFTCLHGKILKFKLASSENQQHNSISTSSLALYFCSQACMEKFTASDVDSLYLESLLQLESLFLKGLTQRQHDSKSKEEEVETAVTLQLENELKQAKDAELFICQKWQEAEINCQLLLSKLKPKQKKNLNHLYSLIPKIDEHEYLEIKYIIGILFHMYKHDSCRNNKLLSLELQIFPLLQSNDTEQMCKYPYLLHSYTRIYKFLRISTFDKLQPYITPPAIRSMIGKRLANAFGIWSRDEPDGNKEHFGYSLYPSASFFNHSCRPNLIDVRDGKTIIFKLLKDVKKDDELLISYIHSNNDDFQRRQKDLREWFIDCSCERCVEEKKFFENVTE